MIFFQEPKGIKVISSLVILCPMDKKHGFGEKCNRMLYVALLHILF